MKISEILSSNKITLSFEVFPPKTSDKLSAVETAVSQIAKYRPDFISVTYGAGGGANCNFTGDLASKISKDYGIPSLAHLTCVGSSSQSLAEQTARLKALNVENVLALRGDIPVGSSPDPWCCKHANELAALLTENGFCVGGACYPEMHPESNDLDFDLRMLKNKVDCGCSFLTAQMFFDNNAFYRFLENTQKYNINVPILAGIMPIISTKQIKRTCELSGTALPKQLATMAERYGDDPDSMSEAGVLYACTQIVDLIANGVNNIHVYVMNRPETAEKIRSNLINILSKHDNG